MRCLSYSDLVVFFFIGAAIPLFSLGFMVGLMWFEIWRLERRYERLINDDKRLIDLLLERGMERMKREL